ncbi:MAG TPA: amidohydrolase, partial [Chloroflexota bacterium]|nr:amidohydrolase [Chloroflexota bacterium]
MSDSGMAIFDTDIHHSFQKAADLNPYLPKIYQEKLADYGMGGGGISYANNGGVKGYRADALEDGKAPPGGGVNAVDPEQVRHQLLDGCGITIGLLTGGSMYGVPSGTDLDYANALCRAFNDFTIEHWLSTDSRFRFAMAVNAEDPAEAAREIDRL